jgi:NADPH:quinone reductase-like Zn-dependent oxidoreductase
VAHNIFNLREREDYMKAAWYEIQGPARKVLTIGDMPDPAPGPGELRIRIAASGINPGDTKKREDACGVGMPYPRVIPHSDGVTRRKCVHIFLQFKRSN